MAAFAGGNIDAWSIWDPYLALAEGKQARVIAFSKDVQDSISFFSPTRISPTRHPDIVALFNKTFADEGKWAEANRAEVATKAAGGDRRRQGGDHARRRTVELHGGADQ